MTQDTSKRRVVVNTQYIKDLSFENPGAPASLVAPKSVPNIKLNVDINVQGLQSNLYEVALHVTAKAEADGNSLFLVDVSYAGVFTLNDIPEDEKEAVLLVYCPNILFPYARRVISDATRDGGFPPLMIDPVDFMALYQRRKTEMAPANDSVVN